MNERRVKYGVWRYAWQLSVLFRSCPWTITVLNIKVISPFLAITEAETELLIMQSTMDGYPLLLLSLNVLFLYRIQYL